MIWRHPDPDEWFAADAVWGKELLLARRGQTEQWEIMGGFVETGETLEQAAVREVREECRAKMVEVEWFGSRVGKYYDGRDIVVAAFTGRLNTKPMPTDECSQFEWVREFPENLPFSHEIDRGLVKDFFKGKA